MTEPVYSYVKGQGWVIGGDKRTIVMACGTVVKVEVRTPDEGEYYDCGNLSEPEHYNLEGEPNWDWWIPFLEKRHYKGMPRCLNRNHLRPSYCLVLVPL